MSSVIAPVPNFVSVEEPDRTTSEVPVKSPPPSVAVGQYPDGAGGSTSLTPASAAESVESGVAPGVKPFNLRMYAKAAA